MKINKNIIAKDLDSPLQLIEIEIEDSYITGKVLVGSGSYVKGKVYKMPYINFVLTTNELIEQDLKPCKIKKGDRIVCISDLLDFTVGEVYRIHTIDSERYSFMVIDDIEENNIIDIENFNLYFKLYKKKDPIVKQVTDKFKQRSKVGIEKYGTTLAENNTDDFLEHLQQELMDATLYIQKLKEQSRTKDIKTDGIFCNAITLENSSSEVLLIELQRRGLCLNYSIHK